MTHVNKNPQDERFYTRLISDDETHYVDTDYTIAELEETLDTLTNSAILMKNPVALKILSLFAFTNKQFEDAVEARSIMQVRFDAFREAVQEIQKLPSEDIKESLDTLLTLDEGLSVILSKNDEFL